MTASSEFEDGFSCTVCCTAGRPVIVVKGDLDLATTPKLETAIQLGLALSPHVVIDLGGVSFMDCAALRVLVEALRCTRAGQGSFALHCVQPAPYRLLGLARLIDDFDARPAILDSCQRTRRSLCTRVGATHPVAMRDLTSDPSVADSR